MLGLLRALFMFSIPYNNNFHKIGTLNVVHYKMVHKFSFQLMSNVEDVKGRIRWHIQAAMSNVEDLECSNKKDGTYMWINFYSCCDVQW